MYSLAESLWSLTQAHSYWTWRGYRERSLENSTQVVSPNFWYDIVVVEGKDERHNIHWSWRNWWGPYGHWHLYHNPGQMLDPGTWLVTGMWEGAITLKKKKLPIGTEAASRALTWVNPALDRVRPRLLQWSHLFFFLLGIIFPREKYALDVIDG